MNIFMDAKKGNDNQTEFICGLHVRLVWCLLVIFSLNGAREETQPRIVLFVFTCQGKNPALFIKELLQL